VNHVFFDGAASRFSSDRIADALFDRGTLGLNWWATRRWKLGFDYGLIELDRKGLTGVTALQPVTCDVRCATMVGREDTRRRTRYVARST
jgi:hypothetical protein